MVVIIHIMDIVTLIIIIMATLIMDMDMVDIMADGIDADIGIN
jgi:hypothetical protein